MSMPITFEAHLFANSPGVHAVIRATVRDGALRQFRWPEVNDRVIVHLHHELHLHAYIAELGDVKIRVSGTHVMVDQDVKLSGHWLVPGVQHDGE